MSSDKSDAFSIHKGLCISPAKCREVGKCLGPCEDRSPGDMQSQLERVIAERDQLKRALARQIELNTAESATAKPFTPTHRHADGGLYRFVANTKYRDAAVWHAAIIYEGADGELWVTSPMRWSDRFTAL
jgi:hypothetical protein